METWRLVVLCSVFMFQVALSKIVLKNNGYEGIVIAINPQVPEDPQLIQSIKNTWTDASQHLFVATKYRSFFRKVTILIPTTWANGAYTNATKGESYSAADVLVAKPNPIFGEFPYTLQYGECGKPGQYIHITPNYLKDQKYEFDTGVRGKVITHEWAHLRWGVFDEVATEGYEKFYLQNGNVQATRCPKKLRGTNRVIDYDRGTMDRCTLNPNTLLPEPGCEFVPRATQREGLYASLMGLQYLEPVIGFCHSNRSDRINRHNTAAPNEHNRLCNLQSTWDVIMSTGDFADGLNSPISSVTDTTPTFEVVQPSPPRYVIVMDVSGSMRGARIQTMQRAASLFVTDFVADGSYVGLVSFESTSRKLSELRKIDQTSRTDLASIIQNTVASGGTGIGSGILTGMEVLQGSGTCGGNLVVLTDGGETQAPYVSDVYYDVINCGAKMHTIFLDLDSVIVNQIMTNLSDESGGEWFIAYSTSNSSDIINNVFGKLSQSDDGDSMKKTYQVYSDAFILAQNSNRSSTVVIDSTVGKDTLFLFTWSTSAPNILLKSPSGCAYATYTDASLSYCPDQPIHTVDNSLSAYKFNVPGVAPAGKWVYTITNPIYEQTFTSSVTSKSTNESIEPIEIDAKLAINEIKTTIPTVVYAKVTQGFSPVLNATVTAVISTPSSTKKSLVLYDDGAGPDVRKNDGIYSRYFYSYEGQGRYSVQVKVIGTYGSGTQTPSGGSPAAFNPGLINDDGTFEVNPNGLSNVPNNTASENVPTEAFERVHSGGSFSYSGPVDPGDVYAPNKITDLRGNQVNLTDLDEGVFVQIMFTAPGDDLDSGIASSYEIRYAFENASFVMDNFDESTPVEQNDIVEGNLSSPHEASNVENFVFKVPTNTENETQEVFVAIRAFDDVGNPSEVSNIRPMTLFFKISALPTDPDGDTTDSPITTTPEYTRTDQHSTMATTQVTTKAASALPVTQPVTSNGDLKTFQILTGVFGGLVLALALAVIGLICKLSSTNAELRKRYDTRGHINSSYVERQF